MTMMNNQGFVEISPVTQGDTVLISVRIDKETYADLVQVSKEMDQRVISTLRDAIEVGVHFMMLV